MNLDTMRSAISQTVKRQGDRLMHATPTAIIIGLVSAALLPHVLPALQGAGHAAPLAAVMGGSLKVLSELGCSVTSDFLLRFIERLRKKTKGRKAPSEEKVREQLEKELLEQWQTGDEEAVALRQEASKLLQAIQGIEAALAAATDDVKQALAQGLAELGGSFDEFRWILDELKDILAEIRTKQALQLAMQKEQLGLQREQLVKTNLLLRLQQLRTPVPAPISPDVIEVEEEIPPADVPCPYKGLAAFEPEDADYFFGREELIAELTARLAETRFLAVVGPSGSGKSSVVRAGLLPTIWRDELPGSKDWKTVLLTPGEHPLEELAIRVALLSGVAPGSLLSDLEADKRGLDLAIRQALAEEPEHVHLVLIVDQFEELFTLCRDENERRRFVEALLTAVHAPDSRVTLVLAIRADFYGRCAAYPDLASKLQDNQVLVGPLSEDELRQAIKQPASQVGLSLEPGLVETVLHDVADAPGALPLLSHALLETWNRRCGYTLTLDGYAETGGVQGAIARTADQVFDEQLSPDQQIIARNIFLRLTSMGEGTEETRRRAKREELIPQAEDEPSVEAVLKTLVSTRLITTSEDTVEIAHEALIRQWPRLQAWLEEDLEGLRIHRQITGAAHEWTSLNRDTGALYRGVRLAVASEWVEEHPQQMSPQEREFIDASQLLRENELRARKRQQFIFIAGMLAIIGILAIASIIFNKQSEQAERIAATAQAASTLAIAQQSTAEFNAIARTTAEANAQRQADLARSRELAALANLALQRGDVTEAYMLSVRSYRTATTLESEHSLYSVIRHHLPENILEGHTSFILSIAFSPDGKRILTASGDGTARIWDTENGTELTVFEGHMGVVWLAVFSPDGKWILTASDDNTARVWDADSGAELAILEGHMGLPISAVFSPDGKRILTASQDGTARVWDPGNGAELAILEGHTDNINSAVFSPDGVLIVTASDDGTVRVWDAESGVELAVLEGHTVAFRSVGLSPDGKQVITVSDDHTVRVWDTESGAELAVLEGHTDSIWSAIFSPDGKRVLTASLDQTARVWDAEGNTELVIHIGNIGYVWSGVFSPNSKRILTTSEETMTRVWDVDSGAELAVFEHTLPVTSVAFSPDGKWIATASLDLTVRVWDAESSAELVILEGHTDSIWSAIFSPDGKRILTINRDYTARIWDTESGAELAVLEGHSDNINSVAYSPDGKLIVTVSGDGTARIWDTESGAKLSIIEGYTDNIYSAVFSPDGKRVLTASDDLTARVWDVYSGAELVILGDQMGLMDLVVESAVFSPDGKRILTASNDGMARVWDANSGIELTVLEGHTDVVNSAVFSPDGKRILTASDDGTARVWDASSGIELAVLEGHTDWVRSAVFSPNGKRIVTVDYDGTTRIWASGAAELLRIAEERLAILGIVVK